MKNFGAAKQILRIKNKRKDGTLTPLPEKYVKNVLN